MQKGLFKAFLLLLVMEIRDHLNSFHFSTSRQKMSGRKLLMSCIMEASMPVAVIIQLSPQHRDIPQQEEQDVERSVCTPVSFAHTRFMNDQRRK